MAEENRPKRPYSIGNWLTEKIIASLLVLFLLVYVIYQAVGYFRAPLKTETLYEYSVAVSLQGPCLVLRDEVLLDNDSGVSGVESYLYDDGERVLVGAPIVEYYANEGGSLERRLLQQTEQEIAMLEEAQNTAVNHVSNADALGRDIKQQLGQITQMSSTGEYANLDDLRPTLVSLLNKRQIATGKETDYQARISALEAQRDSLRSDSERNTLAVVSAPQTGYFSHTVDGFEGRYSLEALRESSVDDIMNMIGSVSDVAAQQATGRLVTNQNWYVAVVVEKFDVQWARAGQTLEMEFDDISQTVPGSIVEVISENQSEDAILIITSNYINAQTIGLRGNNVKLNFHSYTGLRINTQHLRFEGDERGVYVLEKGVVRFKRLDPLYEEASFILSQQPVNPYDSTTVRQFDQIIVKGTDLYDGKIIE